MGHYNAAEGSRVLLNFYHEADREPEEGSLGIIRSHQHPLSPLNEGEMEESEACINLRYSSLPILERLIRKTGGSPDLRSPS